MNKIIVVGTAMAAFGFCCANVAEVQGQAHHKGASHVGGGHAFVHHPAAAQQFARPAAAANSVYVNRAAHIHNPGNIYTSGYANNTAAVRPYAYFNSTPGYYYPNYGNPYGLNNYGSGFNFSILNGPAYPTYLNYPSNLLNSNIRLYPPGTGLVLGVVNGFGAAPASPPAAAPAPKKDGKAIVQIIAPTPDADVMLDDVATSATGRERTFETPVLEAGYRYGYSVTAVWIKNGEQLREVRSVDVVPGQTALVDFTRPALPELVAIPPAKIATANP